MLNLVNEFLSLFVVVPLILFTGLYLSLRLGCIQISKLKMGFSYLINAEKKSVGNISHFEAISTVLAGNLGTGNISGMAVALSTGGPGALVWMAVMAFLGAILKFAGCLLGVKFRHINPEGDYVGGPMYYLDLGLKLKPVAIIFSIFAILCALTVGNLVQVNSISLPIEQMGASPLVMSVITAVLVAVVLVGGMHRFAIVAATVVPLMAALYVGMALYILFLFRDQILPSLELIFQSAFFPKSAAGGMLGYGFLKAVTVGFERGVFATDAGVGIAPILQSSTRTKSPVVEGVVAMVPPLVVMVICSITTLVLMVTGAWKVEGLQSTNMCTYAFEQGLGTKWGTYVVFISLLLFAFTTILAWAYCAERAVEYLGGLKWMHIFQWFFILVIPFGAIVHVDIVWKLADICIAMMLVCNMVGVIGLSKSVIAESRLFFAKET